MRCTCCVCPVYRYALYQLYKSSVSVKGGNRLNQYLNHAGNVRVCYAGMEKWVQIPFTHKYTNTHTHMHTLVFPYSAEHAPPPPASAHAFMCVGMYVCVCVYTQA